jgi:hypothetical protein
MSPTQKPPEHEEHQLDCPHLALLVFTLGIANQLANTSLYNFILRLPANTDDFAAGQGLLGHMWMGGSKER